MLTFITVPMLTLIGWEAFCSNFPIFFFFGAEKKAQRKHGNCARNSKSRLNQFCTSTIYLKVKLYCWIFITRMAVITFTKFIHMQTQTHSHRIILTTKRYLAPCLIVWDLIFLFCCCWCHRRFLPPFCSGSMSLSLSISLLLYVWMLAIQTFTWLDINQAKNVMKIGASLQLDVFAF